MIQYTIWMFLFEIRLIISFVFLYSIFYYCGIINNQLKSVIEKGASEGCYLPVTISDISFSLLDGKLTIVHLRIHSPPRDFDYRWKSDKILDIDSICINFDIITVIQWLLVSRGHVLRIHNVDVEGMTFYIEGWEDPLTGELFLNVSLIGIPPGVSSEYSNSNSSSSNNSNSGSTGSSNSSSTASSTINYSNVSSSRTSTSTSTSYSSYDTTSNNNSSRNNNSSASDDGYFSSFFFTSASIIQSITDTTSTLTNLTYWNDALNTIHTNITHFSKQVLRHGLMRQVYTTATRRLHYSLKQKLDEIHESMSGQEPLPNDEDDIRIYGHKIEIRNVYLHLRNALPVTLRHLEKKKPLFVPYFELLLHNLNDRIIKPKRNTTNDSNNNRNGNINDNNNNSSSSSSSIRNINNSNINATSNNQYNNNSYYRCSSSRGVLGSLLRRRSGSNGNSGIWRSVEREYVDAVDADGDDTEAPLNDSNSCFSYSDGDNYNITVNNNNNSGNNCNNTRNNRSRSLFGLSQSISHRSHHSFSFNENRRGINNPSSFSITTSDANDDIESGGDIDNASDQDENSDNNNNIDDTCWRDVDEDVEVEVEEVLITNTASHNNYNSSTTTSPIRINNISNSNTNTNNNSPSPLPPLSQLSASSSSLISWSGYYHRYTAYELKYNIHNGIHSKILNYRFERALIGEVLKGNAGRLVYDALLDWTTLSPIVSTANNNDNNNDNSTVNGTATSSSSSNSSSRSNSRVTTPHQSPYHSHNNHRSPYRNNNTNTNHNNNSNTNRSLFHYSPKNTNSSSSSSISSNSSNRNIRSNPHTPIIPSSPLLLSPLLNQSHSRAPTTITVTEAVAITTTATTITADDVDSEGSFYEGERINNNNTATANIYDNNNDDISDNDSYDINQFDNYNNGGYISDAVDNNYECDQNDNTTTNNNDNIFDAELIDVNPIFFDIPFSFNNNNKCCSNR